MKKIIPQSFYYQDTLSVAQNLLGCFLVRRMEDGKIIKARIIETEAYIGQEDLACHASKGRTKRTETMFGPPGFWYVYMIYGMYHCLNVITEKKDFPAAVLIRAVGFNGANGPGKLCRDLEIDRSLNGVKAFKKESGLWITEGGLTDGEKIVSGKRIGVAYAGDWAEKEWRFKIFLKW
ncbi:MAG: DNA-3-methyladenine glycosylase [bacterium]